MRSTGQMVAISITIGLSLVFTPIFAATIVEMTTIRTKTHGVWFIDGYSKEH
ncbi:hypothetical protein MGH68_08730 [Erysipelothrix sp. D19-032]